MKSKCKLIIKSLHDAQAKCSCGHWWLCGTGEHTKEEIQGIWKKHMIPDIEKYFPPCPRSIKYGKCRAF